MALTQNDYMLFIVYLNIVLYATCFQLQRPLEPFLVDNLTKQANQSSNSKANAADEYARLQSFFSIVQTVGSLITGYFLDKFSAKLGFIITFLSSALSYYILSISTTMNLLYISKIPTIFQAGFLCAQLAASQLTRDGSDRVQALGRLTMCYTVGMVLGPAIGGWLGATGDYYFAAKLSAAGSLVSVGLTCLMPSTDTATVAPTKRTSTVPLVSGGFTEVYTTLIKIISIVGLLLGTKILTGVANAMNGSTQPLILKNIYDFKETDMGLYMSISSILNTILSGFLLGPIIKFGFKNDMLSAVKFSLFYMTILSLFLSALTYSSVSKYIGEFLPFNIYSNGSSSNNLNHGLYSYIVISYILSIFQYMLSTTLTSESTQRVDDKEKGTLLGLEHSLFAAARVFAPYWGTSLLNHGSISLVSLVTGAMFGGIFMIWSFFVHTLPRIGTVYTHDSDSDTAERKKTDSAKL